MRPRLTERRKAFHRVGLPAGRQVERKFEHKILFHRVGGTGISTGVINEFYPKIFHNWFFDSITDYNYHISFPMVV